MQAQSTRHSAVDHLAAFLSQLERDSGVTLRDLAEIAAWTSPSGWPLDPDDLRTTGDIARALLSGDPNP